MAEKPRLRYCAADAFAHVKHASRLPSDAAQALWPPEWPGDGGRIRVLLIAIRSAMARHPSPYSPARPYHTDPPHRRRSGWPRRGTPGATRRVHGARACRCCDLFEHRWSRLGDHHASSRHTERDSEGCTSRRAVHGSASRTQPRKSKAQAQMRPSSCTDPSASRNDVPCPQSKPWRPIHRRHAGRCGACRLRPDCIAHERIAGV